MNCRSGKGSRTGGGGPSSSQDLNWRFEQGDFDLAQERAPVVVDTVHDAIRRQYNATVFGEKAGRAGSKIASEKLLAEGTEQAEGGVNENVEPRRTTTTGDDIGKCP